jgi:hypothetical protein
MMQDLEPFFLSNENILKLSTLDFIDNYKPKYIKKSIQIYKNKTPGLSFFIPKEKDSLFWSFYRIKYGEFEYDKIKNKNIVFEKQIKIEYISRLRENKKIIKQFKLSTLSDLENNLLNEDILSFNSLFYMMNLEEINFLFIKNNIYFKAFNSDSTELFIIKQIACGLYGYICTDKEYFHNTIENNLFEVSNITKPLKAITSYTLNDLQIICQKLKISCEENNKKKTKKQLYENIIQTI